MTASSNDYVGAGSPARRSVDELARRQGVFTVTTVEDLADDDVFDTDDELDEFLTFVREQRNASLA